MNKKCPLWVVVILFLNLSVAFPSEVCDRIIESTEIGPGQNLWSYIKKLLDEQIISTSDLGRFSEELTKGSLVNPIPHLQTPYGPAIKSSALYRPYHLIQEHILMFQRDPSYLDLNYLKKIVSEELELRGVNQGERYVTVVSSNFIFNLERAMIKNKNFYNHFFYDLLMKDFKDSGAMMASYFAESEDQTQAMLGARLLSQVKKTNNFSLVRHLLQGEMTQTHAGNLLIDDGSEAFYDFVEEASNLPIKPYALVNVIEKIADPTHPRMNNLLKKLLRHEKDEVVSKVIEVLAKDHSPSTRSFLNRFARDPLNHDSARYRAVYQLALLGEGKDILENQASYGEAIRGVFWGELSTLNDEQSLELIQLGQKTRFAEYAIQLLQERNDPASLQLIKELIQQKPSEDLTQAILEALAGRDAPAWALQFIKKNIQSAKSFNIYVAGVSALSGKSSKDSRNFIETLATSSYEKERGPEKISKTLVGRSKEDLLYFFKKYVNHPKRSSFASMALALLYGQEELEVVTKAMALVKTPKTYTGDDLRFRPSSLDKDFTQSEKKVQFYTDYIEVSALYYLASLPIEKYASYWRDLATNHPDVLIRSFAIKRLTGLVDTESVSIFKKGLQDPDRGLQQNARNAYIYYYVYLNQNPGKNAQEIAEFEKLL